MTRRHRAGTGSTVGATDSLVGGTSQLAEVLRRGRGVRDDGHVPTSAAASVPTPAGAASSSLVEARGVVKAYGTGSARREVLRGVDLHVPRGALVALTGASGSGKTTLLHVLAGLATPDAGQALFDGQDLSVLSDDERTDLRAERMGFVFQSLNLLPALTAAENVEVPLVLRGLPGHEVRERAVAALASVGLADRGGAAPAQLSGGEQQRVAVARALVTGPDVLWADEPTGSLDSASAQGVLDLLDAERGRRTVVVVTHDPEVAARADVVVRLQDGRVVG